MTARRVLLGLSLLVFLEAWIIPPTFVQTILFAVSLYLVVAVATEPLKDGMDRLLAGLLIGVMVVLALGFLLHFTGFGLTNRSWTLAWAAILLGVAFWPTKQSSIHRIPAIDRQLGMWSAASLLVIFASFVVAHNASRDERATPLSLSVVSSGTSQIKLSVTGPGTRRDLSLVQVNGDSRQTLTVVDLSATNPFEVLMPRPVDRVSIQLVDGRGAVQRTIIVDPALAIAPSP